MAVSTIWSVYYMRFHCIHTSVVLLKKHIDKCSEYQMTVKKSWSKWWHRQDSILGAQLGRY